jgi:hypothetical protein
MLTKSALPGARRADVTGFGVPEHHGDGSALPMLVHSGNLSLEIWAAARTQARANTRIADLLYQSFVHSGARRPNCVAEGPGFEPGLTESESAILPLNHPPPMEGEV